MLTFDGSPVVINTNGGMYDNFRISFNFTFLPAGFGMDDSLAADETITIGLSSGRVNRLRPGMEGILGYAYNQ